MGEDKFKGNTSNASGAIYLMAFIGTSIYYIQHASSFWDGALGLLKAMVWPAILAYKFLGYIS